MDRNAAVQGGSRYRRFLPFLNWTDELRRPRIVRRDVVAGLAVALILVPQSMAYAQLAGLPVQSGLYAAFLPVIVAALFGSCRQLSTGPTAIASLMTASVLASTAAPDLPAYACGAALLALMAGVMLAIVGALRLSALADLLSHTVVVGFTNGAALVIAASQLGDLLGVRATAGGHLYQTVWSVLRNAATQAHGWTVAVAALALAIMLALKRIWPRSPSVLVAVTATTALAWAGGFEAAGGRVVTQVPGGMPALIAPHLDPELVRRLLPGATAIALVGFIEAASIGRSISTRTRCRLNPNREFVGQGLANIVAACFQGYPVSGSFSRSAVNLEAGAVTGLSSVVAGLAVGAALFGLTPLLYHVPRAALAAVIVVAVAQLVDFAPIRHAWKGNRHDSMAAVVTFGLTLLLAPHVEWAILGGVGISVLLWILRTMRPRFVELSMHADGSLRDAARFQLRTSDLISVLRFDGSLYFGNAAYFEDRIIEHVTSKPGLRYVLLDAEGINEVDATGVEAMDFVLRHLRERNVELLVARPKHQVLDVLRHSGFVERLGMAHFFRRTVGAIAHVHREIGAEAAANCPLRAPERPCPDAWIDEPPVPADRNSGGPH